MLLWDIIRDWFVQYVFGGMSSGTDGNRVFYGFLGRVGYLSGDSVNYDIYADSANVYVPLGSTWLDTGSEEPINLISLGDWLSTTATIITLIALCLFLFLAVKWVFNVFRNTLERVGK